MQFTTIHKHIPRHTLPVSGYIYRVNNDRGQSRFNKCGKQLQIIRKERGCTNTSNCCWNFVLPVAPSTCISSCHCEGNSEHAMAVSLARSPSSKASCTKMYCSYLLWRKIQCFLMFEGAMFKMLCRICISSMIVHCILEVVTLNILLGRFCL